MKTKEELILEAKRLRVDFDKQVSNLEDMIETTRVKAIPGGRELDLAKTKLQECRMWLGMMLQEMAEVYPYPEGNNLNHVFINKPSDKYEQSK